MRGSIFSRLALLGGVCLLTMGAQLSCSSGDATFDGGDDGDDGHFDVRLVLRSMGGVERSTFAFGDSMEFELVVTNQSGATRTIDLPSGQTFDFAVLADGTQNALFRWSINRVFPAASQTLTFASHQSITYPFVWNGVLNDGTQIMPGTYQFRGTLAYPGYDDWRSEDPLAAPLRNVTITH